MCSCGAKTSEPVRTEVRTLPIGYTPPRPSEKYNRVCNYAKLQGVANPGDLKWRPTLSIDYRRVDISNSGRALVAFGISTRIDDPSPEIRGVIYPTQSAFMGVNTVGEPMQYLHLLDPSTGKRVGPSTPLSTDSNVFVLRQGVEFWWTQPFFRGRAF